MVTKEEFDRIQGIGKGLKAIFARDNVGGLNGMEDYLVRAVEEAAQQSTQPPTLAPCSCGGERQLLIRCARCRSVDEYKG